MVNVSYLYKYDEFYWNGYNFCRKISTFSFNFLGMWVFTCFTLSIFSEWRFLSKQYPCNGKFDGEKFSFRTMKIGGVNYSYCVTFGVNRTELYLGIMFLFRIGHKPIKVPFSQMKGKKQEGAFFTYVILSINSVDIRISQKLAERIVTASNGAWRYSDS